MTHPKVFGPESTTVLITHGPCNDGYGARLCGRLILKEKARYIDVSPGTKQDWTDILTFRDEHIVFADVSPPLTVYAQLAKRNRVLILDHHLSAKEDLEGVPEAHKVFDMTHSGAWLAWQFFHAGKEVPLLIRLIEKRDLWKRDQPEVDQLFEYLCCFDGNMEEYEKLLDPDALRAACKIGQLFIDRRDREVAQALKRASFTIMDVQDEFRLVATVNTDHHTSEVGNALLRLYPIDFSTMWYMDYADGKHHISLRSTDARTNVKTVAQLMGGGGHRNAAGADTISESFEHVQSVSKDWMCLLWNALYTYRLDAIHRVKQTTCDVFQEKPQFMQFYNEAVKTLQYHSDGVDAQLAYVYMLIWASLNVRHATHAVEWIYFHRRHPDTVDILKTPVQELRAMFRHTELDEPLGALRGFDYTRIHVYPSVAEAITYGRNEIHIRTPLPYDDGVKRFFEFAKLKWRFGRLDYYYDGHWIKRWYKYARQATAYSLYPPERITILYYALPFIALLLYSCCWGTAGAVPQTP